MRRYCVALALDCPPLNMAPAVPGQSTNHAHDSISTLHREGAARIAWTLIDRLIQSKGIITELVQSTLRVRPLSE